MFVYETMVYIAVAPIMRYWAYACVENSYCHIVVATVNMAYLTSRVAINGVFFDD